MRFFSVLAIALLSTTGCRAILGIDDDPNILSGSTGSGGAGTSMGAAGGTSTSDGGSGGNSGSGGWDPHWARFRIPPDSPPVLQYEIVGGSAIDKVTGLEWERDPPKTLVTRSGLTTRCANKGPGWRMPSRMELTTILWLDGALKKIDDSHGVFSPIDDLNNVFWSTSRDLQQAGVNHFWSVDFSSGFVSSAGPGSSDVGRCVRTHEAMFQGVGHYSMSEDKKVVHDHWTGLSWAFSAPTVVHGQRALTCDATSIGGLSSGWRIPHAKELLSLWDETHGGAPYWDAIFGPGDFYLYWSSTEDPTASQTTYGVDFSDGSQPLATSLGHGDTARIRCVHD